MSTSLLYHIYNIIDYNYVSTDYKDGATFFTIRIDKNRVKCQDCGSRDVVFAGTINRTFRALPSGKKRFLSACLCKESDASVVGRLNRSSWVSLTPGSAI